MAEWHSITFGAALFWLCIYLNICKSLQAHKRSHKCHYRDKNCKSKRCYPAYALCTLFYSSHLPWDKNIIRYLVTLLNNEHCKVKWINRINVLCFWAFWIFIWQIYVLAYKYFVICCEYFYSFCSLLVSTMITVYLEFWYSNAITFTPLHFAFTVIYCKHIISQW